MGDKLKLDNDDHDGLYEPTDSEDELSEEEKELLQKVRQGNKRKQSAKQELMAFADSDDEEDEEEDDGDDDDDEDGDDDDDDGDELMEDSDIEGAGPDDDADIPDRKAWGNKSRNFYNTDFVDPDYSSYTEKELELAQQEEEEGLAIQKRLAEEMQEDDFAFAVPTGVAGSENDAESKISKKKSKEGITKLSTDLSGLSKREKLQYFQKDSPEFMGLSEDLLFALNECSELLNPVLQYAWKNQLPKIPALEFANVMRILLTTYCSNITFYLMLKANRTSIKNHPITNRLLELKNMIDDLSDRYDNIIKPQLEALLERIQDGDVFEVLVDQPAKEVATKKKRSESEAPASKRAKLQTNPDESEQDLKLLNSEDDSQEEEEGDEDAEEEINDEDERRGITYQIAKNKGLTPHRKKELRNPRVKHRSKFRKALIRRKGAVRTVRKESKRYGGEISGIKSTVSKSVKFK